MLVPWVQFDGDATSGSGNLLGPFLLILAGAVIAGLLLPLLQVVVARTRAALRRRRAGRARVVAAAGAEQRARAMMSELCPYGWRAQMTLYDGQERTPLGEPVRAPVALDWFELRPGGGEPAVMRRVWAESIGEALEAMVADRRTDETLEQIELRATATDWPDS